MNYNEIASLIGEENETLLSHTCETVSKNNLHLPSPDFIDNVFSISNRNVQTLRNLSSLFNTAGLAVLVIYLFYR